MFASLALQNLYTGQIQTVATMPDILLTPFKRWFRAPVIETPFSTVPVPSTPILMSVIFFSFGVITSGFVFCVVRQMSMTGYIRGANGRPVVSWIDLTSLSNQFMAEGMVAAIMFSLAAASLIGAFYILSKDENEKLTDVESFIKNFSYTAPLWCLLSYEIFHMKFRAFTPSFFPRR